MPVFLGINVLGWQKNNPNKAQVSSNIFNQFPTLQEVGSETTRSPYPEALYASPFNKQVHSILMSLVREAALKFPGVDGIALNLRLSNREILGYSEAARAASIIDIETDPLDLNLSNVANLVTTAPTQEWIAWRRGKVSSLLRDISNLYRKASKGKQVIVSGSADYYAQQDFNDLRTSQDWRLWLHSGLADHVLLEGR